MRMSEQTRLYQVIYQDIQEVCEELKQKTLGQYLQIVGLGFVEDLCGYFTVGMTLEEFSKFDQELIWFISEWSVGTYPNNNVHHQIMVYMNNLVMSAQKSNILDLDKLIKIRSFKYYKI